MVRCGGIAELLEGRRGGVGVGGEAVLAGAARVAAVAAVVHEQHGEPAAAQLLGEFGSACPVATVAGREQDRHPGVLRRVRRDEPGAQLESVCRVQRDVTGTGDDVSGRGHRCGVGEVDQLTLQRPQHRNHLPPEAAPERGAHVRASCEATGPSHMLARGSAHFNQVAAGMTPDGRQPHLHAGSEVRGQRQYGDVASDSRMVALGIGKFARADRSFALERITGEERGDGHRTRVWIDGVGRGGSGEV